MAKIFAKSKRSAEDDKLLEGFVTKLNDIAAKLRAPTSRTHENTRSGAKADCHHWVNRGECRLQSCRFAHDPGKKGSVIRMLLFANLKAATKSAHGRSGGASTGSIVLPNMHSKRKNNMQHVRRFLSMTPA